MADLTEYPPNLTPRDALVVRAEANAEPQHAVVPYSAEDFARPAMGPANPFRPADGTVVGAKRKASGVLTGTATEIHISEYTFRAKHRAVEAREGGGPGRTGREIKEASAAVRRAREAKGSATVVEGEGSYVGPWARFGARGGARDDDYEVVEGELGSDDEYEVVYEDEDDEEEAAGGAEVVASGAEVAAPAAALARRKEAEELGAETTTFHGSEERDYQGRTYMHVPQDLDVDLRKEVGSITNYIPRKLVHAWKSPSGKAVTSLRLFPRSGHLVLGGYADNTVRLWDFYHDRELLRSFSGHLKAITDLAFDRDGRRFVSGSHDRTMKVWDTESGRCLARFSNGKTPHCLVFNPTPEHAHTFLAGMSDANILCFDTRAGNEPVQEYNHHLAAINTITFVEDGGTFMTTSDDKSIRCWNWDVPVPIKYIAESYFYPITRAALHPSSKYVAFQSNNQVLVYSASDKFRENRKKVYRGHSSGGSAIGLDISPDGQFLASGDSTGLAYFWDWKTSKLYEKLKVDASGGAVTSVLWHPQETSKVLTAGASGDIKVWD